MLRAYLWLYMTFLFLPLGIIALFSVHETSSLTFPFEGFSLRWYEQLWAGRDFLNSFRNSLIVAAAAAAFTTVLGSLAAISLMRLKGRAKTVFAFLNFAPIALPGLFLGIALVAAFSQVGLGRSLVTITIAHTLVTLPFFVEAMRSRIEYFDMSLEDAARDLGAGRWQTFRLVTLPILAPTIVGSAILAFALSFDELIVTVFVSGNDTTLPLFIWSMMRRTVDPSINAASVVALAMSIAVILVGGALFWIQRRRAMAFRTNFAGE